MTAQWGEFGVTRRGRKPDRILDRMHSSLVGLGVVGVLQYNPIRSSGVALALHVRHPQGTDATPLDYPTYTPPTNDGS